MLLAALLVAFINSLASGLAGLTISEAQRIAQLYQLSIQDFSQNAKQTAIETAVDYAGEYEDVHSDLHADLLDSDIDFNVTARAIEKMYERRDLDTDSPFKSLSEFEGASSTVRRVLIDALDEGLSSEEAVDRAVSSIIQGDQALQEAAREFGDETTSRWANKDVDVNANLAQVGNQIENDVERIVRSELAEVRHQIDLEVSKESPFIAGVEWNLNPMRPPIDDICVDLASEDRYGLGPGIYPPTAPEIQSLPHPNCMCFLTLEFEV